MWVKMKDTGKLVELGDASGNEQIAGGFAELAKEPAPTKKTAAHKAAESKKDDQ